MNLLNRLSDRQMLALKILGENDGLMKKEAFNTAMKPVYGNLDEFDNKKALSAMLVRLYDRGLIMQIDYFGCTYRTTAPRELRLTEAGEAAAEEIMHRNQDGRYGLDLDAHNIE